MLEPVATPLALPLTNGLCLRTLAHRADAERVAAFAGSIHGPEVGTLQLRLLLEHPDIEPADLFFVDTAAGEVVSSLCLISWQINIGGVTIPVGEMGIVQTAEDYRRQGLVRAQVKPFMQRLAARGCLLSIIQGIPFYYRQFGYDYALPLEGGWRLELRHVPDAGDSEYTVRLATLDDLPVLQELYNTAVAPLTIHTLRSEAVWRYLLAPYTTPDACSHQTWVVCRNNRDNHSNREAAPPVVGYVRVPEFHFGDELTIDEASRLSLGAAQAILAHLRVQALAAGQPGIRLNLPKGSDLVKLADAWGAYDMRTYAWQIHIPNLAALLRALAPTLHARLANSLFHDYTQSLRLGLYTRTLTLHFVAGQLTGVEESAGGDEADQSLPPQAITPLVLGHRSVSELRHAFPDVNIRGTGRLLLETLFPPVPAFLYPVY